MSFSGALLLKFYKDKVESCWLEPITDHVWKAKQLMNLFKRAEVLWRLIYVRLREAYISVSSGPTDKWISSFYLLGLIQGDECVGHDHLMHIHNPRKNEWDVGCGRLKIKETEIKYSNMAPALARAEPSREWQSNTGMLFSRREWRVWSLGWNIGRSPAGEWSCDVC
jgi:hypothetical protein